MKAEHQVCDGGNEGQKMTMKAAETKKAGNEKSNEGQKKNALERWL